MLHPDQLNRSTGLSTVHAADASIAALMSVKLNGVINRSAELLLVIWRTSNERPAFFGYEKARAVRRHLD